MAQSLFLIILFLAGLMCLPWLIERLKKRYGLVLPGSSGPTRVVSALALGPQQRVVTVEVGPADARVWLVLGVTAQSIQCLHTMAAVADAAAPVVLANTPAEGA